MFNKMKKIASILLIMVVAVSLVSCGTKTKKADAVEEVADTLAVETPADTLVETTADTTIVAE